VEISSEACASPHRTTLLGLRLKQKSNSLIAQLGCGHEPMAARTPEPDADGTSKIAGNPLHPPWCKGPYVDKRTAGHRLAALLGEGVTDLFTISIQPSGESCEFEH
jgi:hypothetical protein